MPWNRIARVAAALLVTAAIAAPAIYASVDNTADQQKVRVGGDIKEPKKIKDVKPVYPEAAKAAGVQGIVIIEAIIGIDGSVNEAKVLRPIPELDKAAIDAVMQWKYTPTLLNGDPVEVIMTVTVTFSLQ
jgi:periplasmic protein TonB